MKLLENETIFLKNSSENLTLTNIRLVKKVKFGGVTNYSSIFLDKISSVQFKSREYKWLLYFAAALVFFGVIGAASAEDSKMAPLIAGLIFGGCILAVYFLTRRQFFEVRGVGAESIIDVTGETFESAFKFINLVEHAMKSGELPAAPVSNSKDLKTV
jgi:hypothetical protein